MWYAVWVRSGQEDRVLELCKTFRHYHPDAYEALSQRMKNIEK